MLDYTNIQNIIYKAMQSISQDYQIHFTPNRTAIIKTNFISTHKEKYTIFIMTNFSGYMYNNQSPILLTDASWTLCPFNNLNKDYDKYFNAVIKNCGIVMDDKGALNIKCNPSTSSISKAFYSLLKAMIAIDYITWTNQ